MYRSRVNPNLTLLGLYMILLFPMLYGVWHTHGRSRMDRILPNSSAIVLQQCGQCRRVGRMKGRLTRAHTTRSEKISTFGSVPCACVLVSPLYYKPSVKSKVGLYTICILPILYGVWLTKGRSRGDRILPNSSAIVLQHCAQCRRVGRMKDRLVHTRLEAEQYLVKRRRTPARLRQPEPRMRLAVCGAKGALRTLSA